MEILGLIPQFGGVVWTLLAFVVALSVIVAVHEYGHYIVGRWSGIKADVFSLGFGPILYSRMDKHGTRWQFAALPFGGYVKFKGDANAASGADNDAMNQLSGAELRETMHGAPLWARTATVAAGPVFNFIFSIIVFTGMVFWTGIATHPPKVAELRDLPFEGITIEPGDTILAINGQPFPEEGVREFFDALPAEELLPYSVLRDGQKLDVTGPQPEPARIGSVNPGSAGETAGLLEGDVILSADGKDVFRFHELVGIVEASAGKPVALEIWRDGELHDFSIAPERRDLPKPDKTYETRWLIGITSSTFYEPAAEAPGPLTALQLGLRQTYDVAALSLSGLYHMAAQKISACNMSGPIGIAKASGQMASAGALSFIGFLALLSTAVGLLNLFPIPILDGGHLVFYAYEAVTRKRPGERVMQVLMATGLTVILAVMLFALSNDLFC